MQQRDHRHTGRGDGEGGEGGGGSDGSGSSCGGKGGGGGGENVCDIDVSKADIERRCSRNSVISNSSSNNSSRTNNSSSSSNNNSSNSSSSSTTSNINSCSSSSSSSSSSNSSSSSSNHNSSNSSSSSNSSNGDNIGGTTTSYVATVSPAKRHIEFSANDDMIVDGGEGKGGGRETSIAGPTDASITSPNDAVDDEEEEQEGEEEEAEEEEKEEEDEGGAEEEEVPVLGESVASNNNEEGKENKEEREASPPITVPVQTAAAASILTSEVPNTVFKVFCTHCEPHYSQPWATRRQTTSTSSGFVTVDSEGNRCLLTNAHSVEHAAVVQVRKRGDHRKYEAKVLCVGLDCDLAMLQVSDSDFWEGVGPPLQWGPSPLLEDPVTVVGYPLGGDNSSVTQGVVSRTDLQQYSMGSSSLLAIQIDAAINPGNSGGPALNKFRQCVGIAFQSLKDGDTENIGYIIPSEVVRHFLEDYRRHGKYLGFGDGGFSWQKLENKYLRQALGLTRRHDGILIKKLDGASAASKVLRKGDMLVEVNGQSIASDGTVPFRNGERILFTWLFSQMFVGDTCKVKIIRDGEGEKEFSFTVGKLNLLVPANSELARPEYLVVGGLVFVTLSEPFLKSEYGDDFDARAPVRLLDRWQHGFQSFPGEQYVVLTHVLAHSLTVGYEHLHNTQVKAFNGTAIKTLRHLADLVDACEDEYWRFDLDHEEVVILQAKAARAALPQILQRNMIPAYKCFASP